MKTATVLAGLISAALIFGSPAALAADYTVSEGKLSDRDFYRAIACGADVGGWCRIPILKWPAEQRHNLEVFVEDPQDGFPQEKVKMVIASVRLAINEVNVSGADIQLKFSERKSAPIHVHMVNARAGETIGGTGDDILDGARIEGGVTVLRWENYTNIIAAARIGIASTIPEAIIRSVVLEEIVQSLGLPMDIKNPYYRFKSIFAEDGNNVYKLRRQDTLALRLQYPTGCERASDCLQQ